MSEPKPGLNHGAVLDGFYLRLRERSHEELEEAENLYVKAYSMWRDLQQAESALAEAEERHRKEYCQVMSENIGHRQRIAELERDLLGVRKKLGEAKEVACSLLEHVTKWKDHACRECVGDGNLAIDGFQCAYHRALTFCPTAARAAAEEDKPCKNE